MAVDRRKTGLDRLTAGLLALALVLASVTVSRALNVVAVRSTWTTLRMGMRRR